MNLELLQMGAMLAIASLIIMKACNPFEQAADYLGRNMGAGAKGSLIAAIGSSLPELLVTMMFVFSGQPELILAGITITAGSAVFNAVLIPAISILYARDVDGNVIESFELDRGVQIRNGIWLMVVESTLIYFLGFNEFTMVMGGILIAMYIMFVMHTIKASAIAGKNGVEDYDYEELGGTENWYTALINFDFNYILFKNREFSTLSAWVVLFLSVIGIGIACHFLAISVEGIAISLGIPVYFSAVVLGAAATSVPDTVLSVKAAKSGDYEDAVGNAIGSNIFDVALSLPVPICIYLAFEGMWATGGLEILQSDALLALRLFVLGTSAVVIIALVSQARKVTRNTAYFLFSVYAVWLSFIIYTGVQAVS